MDFDRAHFLFLWISHERNIKRESCLCCIEIFLKSVQKKNCFLKEKMGKKKAKFISGRQQTKGNGINDGLCVGICVYAVSFWLPDFVLHNTPANFAFAFDPFVL